MSFVDVEHLVARRPHEREGDFVLHRVVRRVVRPRLVVPLGGRQGFVEWEHPRPVRFRRLGGFRWLSRFRRLRRFGRFGRFAVFCRSVWCVCLAAAGTGVPGRDEHHCQLRVGLRRERLSPLERRLQWSSVGERTLGRGVEREETSGWDCPGTLR
jgi:hypothetical protein